MDLRPGQRLLHYRIVEKIGEGGMGAVWQAVDTTLDRTVAIKILPAQFASDNERVTRFEREAKLLAALNHPNIASVYGFHRLEPAAGPGQPGSLGLAMEYVRGEDLQQRLARGPLALDDALDVAEQVARALEAAHAQGIVHRDLKPANIVRAEDGTIKVLDFGLAKAVGTDPVSGGADPSLSPTMTSAGTQAGMIVGTAAYMSPEQARARAADARADMWAFGATLMEMLTGRQVFAGETVSDILAAVLKSEPDWDLLPPTTPRPLRRLLRRCLRKDPDKRLHHPADARIEIEAARSRPDPVEDAGLLQAAPVAEPAWKRVLPWVLASVALIAAVTLAVREIERPQPPAPVPYRFDVEIAGLGNRMPWISPDGRRFAYVAQHDDAFTLHVRAFDESEGRPLDTPGISGSAFWSADGESLAYFREDTLERIRVDGGASQAVCTLPKGRRRGTWSANGSILIEVTGYTADIPSRWFLCHPGNPTPEEVARPLPLESAQTSSHPIFLPDGEHYVFVHHVDGVRQAVLARLGATDVTLMFPTDTAVQVADGWYVFSRQGRLLAQRFDPSSYLPEGEAVKLADRVLLFEPTGRVSLSVARQGTILYVPGVETSGLVWFDRSGQELGPALEAGEYRGSELSPDGRQLALLINDPSSGTGDVWVHDLERGTANRLTDTSWAEFSPRWSPDGTQIVYSSDPEGPPNLFAIGVDGGPPRELVPANQQIHYPTDWTADGKTIVFEKLDASMGYDLWTLDASGGEPQVLLRTDNHEGSGVVSPDGRWLAYTSRETGATEVFVRPFGREGARQRVSIDQGWTPRWDGNGRLFFRSPNESLMRVSLRPDGQRLAIGKPETVVRFDDGNMGDYDLHPDGRILITRYESDAGVSRVKAIANWN